MSRVTSQLGPDASNTNGKAGLMAAHIKHTRRQMTAAADVRNSLLARKTEERQNVAAEREKHVRELLRVTEWRSKAGVGAFPNLQGTQDLPSRDSVQYFLTPFPDGTFPPLAEFIQRHLEPTPEPEPTPAPSPPPIIIPAAEPEPSAASPAVKTEEDDALMESDGETEGGVDKSEPEDNDNDVQPALELESRGPPPAVPVPMSVLLNTPTYSSSPDEDVEMQLALPHTAPVIPSPPRSQTPPPAAQAEPPLSPPPPNRPPVDDLPFAPSPGPISHTDPPSAPSHPPSSQPPTPQKPIQTTPYTPTRSFRFDPSRPLNAPRPLSPPPPDARVPSLEALRGMMFPPEGEDAEEPIPAPPSVPILPPTTTTAGAGPSVIVPPVAVPVPPSPAPNTIQIPVTVPIPPALPPNVTTTTITTTLSRPQISTTTPTTPTTPLRASPQTPKPLTNAYTASLPPLPPLPADLARKVAGIKVRRRGIGGAAGGGVNWGGSGIWSGAAGAAGAAGGGGNMGTGVLGPGGAGAQGWWASVSGGQAPAPGTSAQGTGLEMLRWQAILQINPAHVFARRPTKCVTTHEWRVLRHELEYTRAMQRIEQLKNDGVWSFRQPKKQRGPVLPKTHWDYLMDEMKWLQTDFREERRWKMVLAFELAHAVKDWHAAPAGSEERRAMCVGYECPEDVVMEDGNGEVKDEVMEGGKEVEGEEEDAVAEKDEEELGPDGKAVELRSEPDEEEIEEVEPEDKEEAHTADPAPREDIMGADDAVVELLQEPSTEKEDPKATGEENGAMEAVPGALTKDWAGPEDVDMAGEDGKDDDDADGEAEADETTAEAPAAETAEGAGDTKTSEDAPNPLAGALRSKEAAELTLISTARTELLEIATTASLATTFSIPLAPPSPTSDPSNSIDALTELFPDLSIYTGLSEVDPDPNKMEKRPDESMSSIAAGKLAHASRLFDVKPVLVGALDPARHLFKNKWVGLDEVPAVEDGRDVGPVRQDTVFAGNYLFAPERKSEDKQIRRRPDSGMTHPIQPRVPAPPRDATARLERITWTPEDDALLKSICDAYPNSWALTADVFNSSRVTIKPDMRTDWDCYDRWIKIYGGGVEAGAEGGPMQLPLNPVRPGFPVEIALPSPGGTLNRKDSKTPVKRPTPAFENKKQVRQHFLYDTLRKVVRKRENLAKANQPPKRTIPPPHETHSQLASGQRIYTPAELSKLKAERDARHYAEMVKRRQEIYQQAVAAGRPVPRMPPGLVNIPSIRNAQMSVQMQMQMQQQQQQQQSQQQQPQQGQQTPQPGTQATPTPQPTTQQAQPAQPSVPQVQDVQAQAQALYAARMQTPLSASQRVMPNQQQAQAMMQANINGHQQQMSPPNQAAQSPNLHAPGQQAGPSIARPSSIRPGSGSPGIVNGQAMSHLLRTSGMHQMHMNLANGVVPPNMQQNAGLVAGLSNGNSIFGNGLVNGASGMRGQLGPEQMNQLLLQQAARLMQQNQQQQQQQQQQQSQQQQPQQLQVPSLQQSTPDGDVTMQ